MKNAFFYFFLCPFLGFINAINHYRSDWAKPTLIAFVAFFGMSMVKSEKVDSSRYVAKLELMNATSLDFDSVKESFYNDVEGQPDLYVGIVTYIFSLFTNNGNILFLFYGFVFGYFYVNNIWLVLKESKEKLTWLPILLLLTYSFVFGFWTITGVRMNTAAHVFFYGGFLYLYHNKKKGLLIALSSILFHFSFALPVALLIIYSLVRLNYRFIYFFYLASFFVAELNVDFIRNSLEVSLPEFLQPRVNSYLNEEYIENVAETSLQTNWYIAYFQKFLSYFTLIFFSVIFLKADLTKQIKKLLGFSLLFLAVANIVSLLPSGGRFLNVAFLFSMACCFIIVLQSKRVIVLKTTKLLSPLLLLFCIISVRSSFDFFNITTLTNPIVVMFTDINVPLIDFIK
jgi:hypothetical protein